MNAESYAAYCPKDPRSEAIFYALQTQQNSVVLGDDGCTNIYGTIRNYTHINQKDISVVNMSFATDINMYKGMTGIRTLSWSNKIDAIHWEEQQKYLVVRNLDSYLKARPELSEEDDYFMYMLYATYLHGNGMMLTYGSHDLPDPNDVKGVNYWLTHFLTDIHTNEIISCHGK